MAVPGFFAPVGWVDRILVDGGISDNLPTRVARALGATRIIAVDVSRPHPTIESQAPFAVIGRALDLMQEASQNDPIPPDVLIKPDVSLLGTGAQFPNDPTPAFEIGYAAAIEGLTDSPPDRPRAERPPDLPPIAPGRFISGRRCQGRHRLRADHPHGGLHREGDRPPCRVTGSGDVVRLVLRAGPSSEMLEGKQGLI